MISEKAICSCKEIRRKWKKKMWRSTKKETDRKENYPFASLGVRINEWKWGGFSKPIMMLEKEQRQFLEDIKAGLVGSVMLNNDKRTRAVGGGRVVQRQENGRGNCGWKEVWVWERESNGWFWDLDLKEKKERVSARVSKIFKVWFWEFNLNKEGW